MQLKENSFTEGKILQPLLKFVLPILGALLLQATYGAVDLMVVGRFCGPEQVSAVSTGSQLMHTITNAVAGLAMGTTVLLGQRLGEKRTDTAGNVIGNAIWLFSGIGLLITVLVPIFADGICSLMQAPEEAFAPTKEYVTICALGGLFIVAYNVLGSVFRGMGDSKTPLLSVCIACVCNIGGDIFFVSSLGKGAAGAALATVISQGISVIICLVIIAKRKLPFPFGKSSLKPDRAIMTRTFKLGAPIALQDILVSFSFMVLLVIINRLGVIASAGMGVAEKICSYIMLIPSAFAQALAAFVAQNIGAGKEERGSKGLFYSIAASFSIAILIWYTSFFHGDILCRLFTTNGEVVTAGFDYLKAYAIDVMLTSFMFCFVGYFNGCGLTTFTMVQGLIGAFGIRIPVSYLMSHMEPVTLFKVGLATPCSTFVQIMLCVWYYRRIHRCQ